ncbi:ABC transporter ATP-binding protein [Paractinoplanes durhamensis]|uniref:ABC transporter domain-containing protein n=1 Tax=Paractinoplanes durhamensis TaxID=113563 RepID=A0ABQ3YNC1_9ACTN|nr:ATP-binding cassette domain-containing protein [Actinoplanes durhamensis]GID98873.1 hypothetical protein Adu01nite_02240 [Actinoplanes durhamensis]
MPVLTARGAGVRQRRRWLFRDLDVSVEAGEVVAVLGPPGSGRTTLLLTLARRFKLAAGHVTIDGRAALGHVPTVTEPEPVFTVTEHVHEQLALFGRRHREATGVDLRGLDPDKFGRDLSPYEKQVLGLVLARLESPAVIAVDGLDEGLDDGERAALLRELTEIAATGTAVLFTAREIDPAAVTTVIRLGADHAIHLPAEEPEPEVNESGDEEIDGSADGDVGVGDESSAVVDGADGVRTEEAAADRSAGGEDEGER